LSEKKDDKKVEDKREKRKEKDESKKEVDRTFPEVKAGSVVRVHQKIKDVDAKGKEKERIQVFEGMVLARKHGNEPGATITVRKVSSGIGVEKIFPLALPQIEKIEVIKKYKVNRAKVYYTREYKKKLREVKK